MRWQKNLQHKADRQFGFFCSNSSFFALANIATKDSQWSARELMLVCLKLIIVTFVWFCCGYEG
jgi:hypothetical protein